MPEYIEREALKKVFKEKHDSVMQNEMYSKQRKWYEALGYSVTLSVLENAPTADVVEVVRCRNCMHGQYAYLNGQKIATGVTCEYDQDRIKPFNHFCGNGERKDR